MTDLLVVLLAMIVVAYAAYFIRKNDGAGNSRPDKTLFAMEEDVAVAPKRRGRFAPTPPLRTSARCAGKRAGIRSPACA